MIWDELDFIVRETALQLRRERLIAIATVSTVAVLVLVLGALALFHLNVRLWTERIASELEVWGYFARDFSRAEAVKAASEIADWEEVRSAQFVPKEEGLKRLRTYLPGSRSLRGIGNPLPDAVRLRVRDPRLVATVAGRLADINGVKDVVPSAGAAAEEQSVVRRVMRTRRAISWAGVVVGLLVALAGVFIVHNTIRLALHARWREIYIMQLVGATRPLVAAPFLLEGMIHGVLGSVLACCALIPAHMYLRSLSARAAPFFLLMPDRALVAFGLYLVLAGALLGLTGSAISIRRFLRRRPGWQS